MALIKCEECNKEISSRAISCPHCGCPVSKNESTKNEKQKESFSLVYNENKIEVEQKVEKCPLSHKIICFTLSFILFLFIVMPLKYSSTYYETYNIINSFRFIEIKELLLYIPFGIIIFINFFINITSKKSSKISFIIYILSIIFYVFINYLVYSQDVKLEYVYILMYIVLLGLTFIRPKFKLESEIIKVDSKEKEKIEKNNKKIEEYYEKEKNSKIVYFFMLILFTIVGIISSYIFLTKEIEIPLNSIENIKQIEKNSSLYVIVKNEYINVREHPGTKSKKIAEVIKNEKYEVKDIKEKDGYRWYKVIDSQGREGYIANPLIGEEYIVFELLDKKEINNQKKYEFHNHIEDKKETEEELEETKPKEETNNQSPENQTPNKKPQVQKPVQNQDKTPESNKNNSDKNEENSKPPTQNDTSKEDEEKKEICNQKILERTQQYENDKKILESQYVSESQSINNEIRIVESQLNSYGGYITNSEYRSEKNYLSSQLSTAQQNLQRALMDSSGASASKVLRYQNEIRELTKELSDLSVRNDLSVELDSLNENYNYTADMYKYNLKNLYEEFSSDLDQINSTC